MGNKKYNNPFGYIKGPFYTYIISRWVGSKLEPIYVGRGRGYRAKVYYKLRKKESVDRYRNPKSHNLILDAFIANERSVGRDVAINAKDHGDDLQAARDCEKFLIKKYGRLDLGTGTLANRNSGG